MSWVEFVGFCETVSLGIVGIEVFFTFIMLLLVILGALTKDGKRTWITEIFSRASMSSAFINLFLAFWYGVLMLFIFLVLRTVGLVLM